MEERAGGESWRREVGEGRGGRGELTKALGYGLILL